MIRNTVICAALFIAAAMPAAAAQRCPPNSHAAAVGIPGNLRTAQCFCNRGYVSIRGVCVPANNAAPRPQSSDPAKRLVPPQR